MVEFPFLLLTLLQPKSYPVPSISVRIFSIPKLQNIHCGHFTSELSPLFSSLSSLFIKNLPNHFFVRPYPFSSSVKHNWSFRDHLPRSLPTENIFDLLRQSISSESLLRLYSAELVFDMLEIIIKWLKVGFRNATNNLKPLRLTIRFALGTRFQATERLVRSLPG